MLVTLRWSAIGIVLLLVFGASLSRVGGREAAIEEWVAGYDGGFGSDAAWDLAVDSAGNVYVTGDLLGEETLDVATVKYGARGEELWSARFDAGFTDQALSLAIDDTGVYVTSHSFSEQTLSDYTTIKYGLEGDELWVAHYDGLGTSQDLAQAIGVDTGGNVYVVGPTPTTVPLSSPPDPTLVESPIDDSGDEDGGGSSGTLAAGVIIVGSIAVALGGFLFWYRRTRVAR